VNRSRMPQRGSTPRSAGRARFAVSAVAAMVAVWLGYVIVGDTTASTSEDMAEALALRPNSPGNLVALAEERLAAASDEATLRQVEELAARALASAPLEARALRALALVADVRGASGRADALMRLAVLRARRDALGQTWLLARDLDAQNMGDAADRIDVILRARPDLRPSLLPTVAAMAESEEGRAALVAHLAGNPSWRGWILDHLPKVGEAYAVHGILSALRETGAPPTNAELAAFIGRLVAEGQVNLAYLAWVETLPAQRQGRLPFMYNGSFDEALTNVPFDWSIAAVKGAKTEIAQDGGDRALRVTFANARVGYRHVRKLLVLPPGTYQLTGAQWAHELQNERGLAWRVRCAGEKETIGESAALMRTVQRERFSLRFTVPANCAAQWLSLELLARTESEELVSGEAWYDDLAIERTSPVS
jgi:hypothetical protein